MRSLRSGAAWALTTVVVCACAAVVAGGASPAEVRARNAATGAAPAAPRASGYVPPAPEAHSGLSWTEACEKLQQKMSREYAFTRWRGIDWRALYATRRPRIAAAQAAGDLDAFYLTLRALLRLSWASQRAIRPQMPPMRGRAQAPGCRARHPGGGRGEDRRRAEEGTAKP